MYHTEAFFVLLTHFEEKKDHLNSILSLYFDVQINTFIEKSLQSSSYMSSDNDAYIESYLFTAVFTVSVLLSPSSVHCDGINPPPPAHRSPQPCHL